MDCAPTYYQVGTQACDTSINTSIIKGIYFLVKVEGWGQREGGNWDEPELGIGKACGRGTQIYMYMHVFPHSEYGNYLSYVYRS